MTDRVELLSLDCDLTHESESELAATMAKVCQIYSACLSGISTATGEALIRVEYVASEIIRRKDPGIIKEGDSKNATTVTCRYRGCESNTGGKCTRKAMTVSGNIACMDARSKENDEFV